MFTYCSTNTIITLSETLDFINYQLIARIIKYIVLLPLNTHVCVPCSGSVSCTTKYLTWIFRQVVVSKEKKTCDHRTYSQWACFLDYLLVRLSTLKRCVVRAFQTVR